MKNEKSYEEKMLEKMINGITKRPSCKVEDLLANLKVEIKADVRFRPVDWKGKAVVYVPGWSRQKETEDVDPELFRRVFFDPEEPSRMDCLVGLVARVARIHEEEKTNPSSALLESLKEGVAKDEIRNPRYVLNKNVENEPVFTSFIKRLKDDTNNLGKLRKKWENFYARIANIPKDREFFDKVENANPPWGGNVTKTGQWNQLQTILEHPIEEQFLQKVGDTVKYYGRLHDQWDKYTLKVETPRCEIAVPVITADRLLGILNSHRETPFTPDEVRVSLYHAALLAIVLLRNQAELLKSLQKVAEVMTAETRLERIALEIAKSIRETLVGLKPEDIYPLLYVCKRPISAKDDLQDFAARWRDSYQMRQEPQDTEDLKLWNREQELGPIPIRINGLGYKSVEKWRVQAERPKSLQAKDYFVVSGDVDNPDSDTGSRTALKHVIKTSGCLPLVFSHQVYGLLYLHCTKHHFFTEAELEALETFGVQAAIAINNAKLVGPSYEELYGGALLDSLIEEGKDEGF